MNKLKFYCRVDSADTLTAEPSTEVPDTVKVEVHELYLDGVSHAAAVALDAIQCAKLGAELLRFARLRGVTGDRRWEEFPR